MVVTSIQVKEHTLHRLKEHKYFERQSYDAVINRILDEVEDETLSDDEIDDLKAALQEVKEGKLHKLEDVARELGISL